MSDTVVVNLLHFFKQGEITTRFLCNSDESLHVLGETKSPKPDSRAEEGCTDSRIQPHALRHLSDVRAHDFTEISNHIDERNLHRKKRVGSMLDQFGGVGVGKQENWILALRAICMQRTRKRLLG